MSIFDRCNTWERRGPFRFNFLTHMKKNTETWKHISIRGISKILTLAAGILGLDFAFSTPALAWGVAVHTAVACHILENAAHLIGGVGIVIRSYPLEFLYGSLSADFFVGKGQKSKEGHSHNWETGHQCLAEADDDREASYAYGFLSHLAADVVAHNYFVPNLIHRASTWKRMGHLYWEARVDRHLGPLYTRIAREVLTMKDLGCDDMLKSAVGKRGQGLKARRRLFTQSVILADYLQAIQSPLFSQRDSGFQIPSEYISFSVGLSYRLAHDVLKDPETSRCLDFDPIGARNLLIAGRHLFFNRVYRAIRPPRKPLFKVDERLLGL